MELSAYQIALIGLASSIVGALITLLAGHWLAKILASHTHSLQKLDENRAKIIALYSGVYPTVTIEWPKDIKSYLDEKNPRLCELIHQCQYHMKASQFSELLKVRDQYLSNIDEYIYKQNNAADIMYNNASPRKGQSKFHKHIGQILETIR
jgi:hypothetical protein